MKSDESKHDANGEGKHGKFKEYFKDGMPACVGKHGKGGKTGV